MGALFGDYGNAWNRDQPTPAPRAIYSVGAGLIYDWGQAVHSELYLGHALKDLTNPGHSLQDEGIYFRVILWPKRWGGAG